MKSKFLSAKLALLLLLACLGPPGSIAQPASSHPRLWIRQSDLPRLRSWAVNSNPFYAGGLSPLLDFAKSQMDEVNTNNIPPGPNVPNADTGGRQWEAYPTEHYAELFAFMSLIAPSQAERDALAQRARTLLMHVINEALKGPDTNSPPAKFRDPLFYDYDSNRARYYGEAYALTVDWIYPYLSAADKSTIRTVFLRWADEIVHSAYPKSPEPVGVTNDPVLLAPSLLYGSPFNPVRWAGNNYFTGNMRNLGLLAMAFDPEDDPGGTLRGYLANAAGAFLYIVDYLLRNDSRGGLLPEGFEYGPQTGAYITQLLLAMYTAGQANPDVWGPQVVLTNSPFWKDFIPAYLHSLSPVPVLKPDETYLGPLYRVAWYGDGEREWAPDYIAAFGPLALLAQFNGDSKRVSDIRWIQTYLPPGGPDLLMNRAGDNNSFSSALFYFLLFDPTAGPPTDPHSGLDLTFFAPGLQRVLARTSWDTNASWFSYKLGWNSIDHQTCDGNQIELYRRGEFLTKERTGWGLDAGSSDDHNTLALENDPPDHNSPDDYRHTLWERGSQWVYLDGPDPRILARSFRDEFVYLLGDAAPLYNWAAELSTNITEASRSVCWLKPDHVIIYDRAASAALNRFKRFWLNFATNPVVVGNRSTVTLASGQQAFVTTLLPEGASITSEADPDPPLSGATADFENMQYRLRVEAPGNPQRTRFLNVLQGADAGAGADPVSLVRSSGGNPFAGALVQGTLVLFPESLDAPFTNMTYAVTTNATAHWITGLTPNQGYRVESQLLGANVSVTLSPGAAALTDSGGVLVLSPGRQPITSVARLANGAVRLRFIELAGRTYTIQASFDLKQWTDLGTASLGVDGIFQFDDTTSTGSAMRFYRKVAR